MDGLLFTQFPPLFDGFVAAIIMSWWLVAVGYGDSCYHHACHLLYIYIYGGGDNLFFTINERK